MANKGLIIGIGILVILILGFVISSNVTGSVITGSSVIEEKVENEYFKINPTDSGEEVNEEGNLNDTQNNSRPR